MESVAVAVVGQPGRQLTPALVFMSPLRTRSTCKRSVFENPNTKPHFDTNHCVTVLWEEADVERATEKLVATIRATRPPEARMGD
jgi:hypothetical protein